MSRVSDFLEGWVSKNIFPEGFQPEGDDSEARLRAEQCFNAAVSEGLTKKDIENEVDDLVGYMSDAIESANDEEIARQSAKDG